MVSCPRCHAEVEHDWHWCQVCGFDPDGLKPPEPAWDAPGAPAPGLSPAGPPPPWGAPPAGPMPAYGAGPIKSRRSGSTVALIIVASVVGGLVVLAVVLVAAVALLGRNHSGVTSAASTATVAPGASSFVAPDGSFGAAFPVAPSQGPSLPTEPGANGGQTWVARSNGVSYIAVEETLLPGKRFDATGSFARALDGLTTTFAGTYTSKTTTTVAGHPAEKFSLTGTNGLVLRGTVVLTPQALYLIAAAGPAGTGSSLQSFSDSLVLPG